MADDRPPTSDDPLADAADAKKPKRPAPTLDLSATEIPRAGETPEMSPRADEPPAVDPVTKPPPRDRPPSTIVIPALAGAAAASLVMIVISLAGWPVGSPTQDATPAAPANTLVLDDLAARLARVEARPAPTPQPATPSLAPRIDALDKAVAGLRDDLAALRKSNDQTTAVVNELKSAPPVTAAAAPPPDLSAITSRLAQLDNAIKAQADAAAKQAAKPADDAPLRRVVAASLLDMQVRQGQPYVAALNAASGTDASVSRPLQAFAATGVPSTDALARDLLALLPKLTPAPATTTATTGTGLIDRLQAGAARLVKIERSDTSATASSAAVTRAAEAARRNDLAAARRELATLPPADQAIVQPWIDRNDARDAALAASQRLVTDAMTALAKSPS